MTIRLLLVDDHEILLAMAQRILDQHQDIEVVGTSTNGRDAIRISGELAPDVVLMDVAMPGLGGIEATHRILKTCSDTKVLAMSQHTDAETIIGMLLAGAIGFLSKNRCIEELLLALRAVAAGHPYFSPDISSPLLSAFIEKHRAERPRRAASRPTGREVEVLQLVSEGNALVDIAEVLGVSARTVESHVSNLKRKLGVTSLAGLVKYAIKNNYTSVDF